MLSKAFVSIQNIGQDVSITIIVNNNSVNVRCTYVNKPGKKNIIDNANADIVNINIPRNTLKGLHKLNNTIKPVQVTAIEAMVARLAFEMPVKYWNR